MNGWESPTGNRVIVESTGLYIDGEYLEDESAVIVEETAEANTEGSSDG